MLPGFQDGDPEMSAKSWFRVHKGREVMRTLREPLPRGIVEVSDGERTYRMSETEWQSLPVSARTTWGAQVS
jgi:hypothetical protein